MRPLLVAVAIGVTACSGITEEATSTSSVRLDSETIPQNAASATVARVLDGDSLIVEVSGTEFDLRLFGLNAPESDECGGTEARAALEQLATETIELIEVDRDQYDRVIGIAWSSSGSQLNVQLVRSGLAVAVTGATDDAPDGAFQALIEAQERARADGLGLWADDACGATSPRPQAKVSITSPNPPGPDEELLDEEFVTVSNTGENHLDLDGWVLRDESTVNRFRFPTGLALAPGQSVDVISGCQPSDGQLAWCADRSVWNNGGDSAYLLDEFGRIVATDRYVP